MVAPKSIHGRKPCTFRGGRGIQERASPSMLGGGGQCGCGCGCAARGCGCAARGAGGGEYVGAIFPYIIFIYMDKLY